MNIFRTNTKNNSLAIISTIDQLLSFVLRQTDICILQRQDHAVPFHAAKRIYKVHLWRSDKSCYEQVIRLIIQYLWCIYLLYDTTIHNYDSGSQCHSLCLIMCYIDNGSSQSLMQSGNLYSHLSTKLGIQIRQWLIHQEYLWITHDRTSHRYSLTLTT